MTFNATDYLVYYNPSALTESRFVSSSIIIMENFLNSSFPANIVPSNTLSIMVSLYGSANGNTWTLLGHIGTATYATNEWATATQKTITYTTNFGAYPYHKLSFTTFGYSGIYTLKILLSLKRLHF